VPAFFHKHDQPINQAERLTARLNSNIVQITEREVVKKSISMLVLLTVFTQNAAAESFYFGIFPDLKP
jgi:hypothetical protein